MTCEMLQFILLAGDIIIVINYIHTYPSYIPATDIDECLTSTHGCHSNADCTNSNGSFSCACMSGYTGNGVNCEGVK